MTEDYERKNWLIMLYLSGDNNLSPDMVWAINELRGSGVPEGFAITIQFDALMPGNPTARYAIDEHTRVQSGVTGPIPFLEALAEELVEDDAASPEVLADFVRWSIRKYPSKHRMLILSGHGSGMLGDFLVDEQARRSLQPGTMSIGGLKSAIEHVRRPFASLSADMANGNGSAPVDLPHYEPVLHVLGLDSCLMSNLEVATELNDPELVHFLVASEGFVPNTGWPFGFLMQRLHDRLDAGEQPLDPSSLCECLVEDCAGYYDSYLPAGVSFDIASCDLGRLEPLQDAVKRLTEVLEALPAERFQDLTILAHWRAQSFKWEQYTDLADFCEQLRLRPTVDAKQLEAVCDQVIASISDVVTAHKTVGIEFQHARGLSLYFPWSVPAFELPDPLAIYAELEFPRKSGWLDFLKHYVEATKRPPAQLDTRGKVIEWPTDFAFARGRGRAVVTGTPAGLLTKVSPELRTKVSPELRTKVAPELHTKVSPELHTKMAMAGVIGSMKNPPQTVKIPVPSGMEFVST
jgi:hypothetical protein